MPPPPSTPSPFRFARAQSYDRTYQTSVKPKPSSLLRSTLDASQAGRKTRLREHGAGRFKTVVGCEEEDEQLTDKSFEENSLLPNVEDTACIPEESTSIRGASTSISPYEGGNSDESGSSEEGGEEQNGRDRRDVMLLDTVDEAAASKGVSTCGHTVSSGQVPEPAFPDRHRLKEDHEMDPQQLSVDEHSDLQHSRRNASTDRLHVQPNQHDWRQSAGRELAPTAKRRRLDDNEDGDSDNDAGDANRRSTGARFAFRPSTSTVKKSPTTSSPRPPPTFNPHPLFGHAQPPLRDSAAAPRPRFITATASRPATVASDPQIPLPEAFSPRKHRRGRERYLPGGWASQMRAWVVDAGGKGGDAEGGVAVVEVVGVRMADAGGNCEGMCVVRGRRVDSGGKGMGWRPGSAEMVDVVLAGPGEGGCGGGSGLAVEYEVVGDPRRAATFEGGTRIRLGLPCWTVDLDENEEAEERGKTWLVCAGWRLLRKLEGTVLPH